MKQQIKKIVFPVAGLGTRFLPATKATPKEMLPIVDKPLIQYAVEEAVAAGMTEMIFITSHSKRAIEDHFDSNFELESMLKERSKEELLPIIENILPAGVSCIYIRQQQQLGLGHAVLCAKEVVGDEPFAVALADDLIMSQDNNCMQEMIAIYQQSGGSVIAVEEINPADTEKYGIVGLEDNTNNIEKIVEKPRPADAPSNLAVVGRYILPSDIFQHLEQLESGALGELQLTDAIANLLPQEKITACHFSGKRYDCGSKQGYLAATVEYALRDKELGTQFRDFLRERLQSD